MPELTLPEDARHYLLLQRTEYQSGVLGSLFRKLRLRGVYDRYLLPYFDRNSLDDLSEKYATDLRAEYETMRPHLPATVDSILDIGCGLGGIDVYLDRHYDRTPRLSLLDRDTVSDIYYRYEQTAAAYNSLALTEKLARVNGIDADRLRTVDVDEAGYPRDETFDLIVSLLSWGYHYPLETYLDDVTETLAPGGTVILDVRKRTDGRATLSEAFDSLSVVEETGKRARIAARSPA